MFAVVKYFNYRKEVSFETLAVYTDYWQAERAARKYAEEMFEKVVEGVQEPYVYLAGALVEFTSGTGYDKYVFGVVEVVAA
jgi:hypothetical protein